MNEPAAANADADPVLELKALLPSLLEAVTLYYYFRGYSVAPMHLRNAVRLAKCVRSQIDAFLAVADVKQEDQQP